MQWEFLCKYCGAKLDSEKAVGGVVQCAYCNKLWTLPKKDASPAALSFLRMGEHDLDTCKFDDAYTAYAKAAELDGKEPEAYFGMALATFKVQLLRDEVNERMQPICHEISDRVFSDDGNFRKALELATEEQRREYRKRGREIDEIKEEFYDLERKGLDYDCFLCVKVTGEDGRTHTADYDRANEIYYYLKDEGYKPFFSEREMKGRTGSDYEALILYALYRSECMLIVCSDESYLQTKWVKNEYTRFIHMLANEEKERDALSFAFHGTPVEKLPSGKKVQGIDLSKPDAYSRIGNFVKAHTSEAKKKREAEKERRRQEEEARKRQLEERKRQEQEAEEKRRAEEEAKEKELAALKEKLEQMERERATASSPEGSLPAALDEQEDEKRLRAESARKMREEEEEKQRAYLAQFEIENGVLKKYKGNGGKIVIPDGVTAIGEYAFQGCHAIMNIFIPDSVTSIAYDAFDDCDGLADITVSEGNNMYRSEGNCLIVRATNELKLGGINSKIPNGVTSIGACAFYGRKGLTSIIIPAGVSSIGWGAFWHTCRITSIAVAEGNETCRSEGNCIIERATNKLIVGCKKSQIPNGVTSIGVGAFLGCSMTNITIPDGVTSIEDRAFEECMWLERVEFPNSLVSIGRGVFLRCKMTSVEIPNSVTKIGDCAFEGCHELTSVTIPKRFKGGIMNKRLKNLFGYDYDHIKFSFI